MKQVSLLLAVSLFCATSAFNTQSGPLSINGIYDGRFGIEKNIQAVFDMGGVTGYVQFFQAAPGAPTQIHVNLNGLEQYPDNYIWRIHSFPVPFHRLRNCVCNTDDVGELFDPLAVGAASCSPNNHSACAVGDLVRKHGGLLNDMPWQVYEDNNLELCGENSIIGRSILINRGVPGEPEWICANIEPHGARVDRLRAAFDGSIQGDIIITKVAGRDDALVHVDLFKNPPPVDSPATSNHSWNIRFGPASENCSGPIFGEETIRDSHVGLDPFLGCSRENQRLCRIGDLTTKCGALDFDGNGRARAFCTDNQLGSIPCSWLYDKKNPDQQTSIAIQAEEGGMGIIACADIRPAQAPQIARCTFHTRLIFGDFFFFQDSPNGRTYARTHLTGLRGQDAVLIIRENPVPANYSCDPAILGDIYAPSRTGGSNLFCGSVDQDRKTSDNVVLGNLGTKIPIGSNAQSVRSTTSSSFMPLFGPFSITGRSLVLVRVSDGAPLGCCTIERTYAYPVDEIASLMGFQDSENPPVGK